MKSWARARRVPSTSSIPTILATSAPIRPCRWCRWARPRSTAARCTGTVRPRAAWFTSGRRTRPCTLFHFMRGGLTPSPSRSAPPPAPTRARCCHFPPMGIATASSGPTPRFFPTATLTSMRPACCAPTMQTTSPASCGTQTRIPTVTPAGASPKMRRPRSRTARSISPHLAPCRSARAHSTFTAFCPPARARNRERAPPSPRRLVLKLENVGFPLLFFRAETVDQADVEVAGVAAADGIVVQYRRVQLGLLLLRIEKVGNGHDRAQILPQFVLYAEIGHESGKAITLGREAFGGVVEIELPKRGFGPGIFGAHLGRPGEGGAVGGVAEIAGVDLVVINVA